jgi:hypothetical protein
MPKSEAVFSNSPKNSQSRDLYPFSLVFLYLSLVFVSEDAEYGDPRED